MAVTYRGPVEELQGTDWDVPETVIRSGQGAKWIESQHRQAQAEKAAKAEAEQRQRELLAARLEQQRQQAEAEQEALAQEQEQAAADSQFRVELSDLSQSVMAAGAAIVGKGELIEAQTREWEGRHEAMVANSEQVVADAKAQVEFSNAVTQANTDALNEHMTQQRQEQSAFEAKIWETIKSPEFKGEKGDKGERGMRGSGFAYIDADPTRMDQKSLGEKAFGAPPVSGDTLARPVEGGLEIWRTPDGKGWQQVDYRANKQELVSQRLAISDHSSHTMVSMPAAPSKGEGGSADNLRTVLQGQGVVNRLASLDRYAAIGYSGIAKSALISVEATVLDGPHVGQTGTWLISAALNKLGSCDVAIYAELGEIVSNFGVAPSIEIRTTAGFTKPTSVTGVYPTAASIECFCNGWLEPSTGWAGRPNQMVLKGWIKWNTDDRIIGATPAWTLAQEYA